MNAKHTLLTHISQRYPKLPKSSSHHITSQLGEPAVGLAFDLMSVRVGEMWRMAYYMEAIDRLFADEEEDEGDDTAKAVEQDVKPASEDGVAPKMMEIGEKKVMRGKSRRKNGSTTDAQLKDIEEQAPTKRECSPSSAVPEMKRAKSDLDMTERGEMSPKAVL